MKAAGCQLCLIQSGNEISLLSAIRGEENVKMRNLVMAKAVMIIGISWRRPAINDISSAESVESVSKRKISGKKQQRRISRSRALKSKLNIESQLGCGRT
jgi:hypothetical protein